MRFRVFFSPEAEKDPSDAVRWYNSQHKGLGNRFLDALAAKVTVLEFNPYFAIRFANVRALPLARFPFLILFTVDEEARRVEIRGVFSTRTDPQKMRR